MRFANSIRIYLNFNTLNKNIDTVSSRVHFRYSHNDLSKQNFKLQNPLKKKRRKYLDTPVTNRLCLTIMGNGAPGQPCCVALFTEIKGYIFNCGEGVGRLCREYEVDFYSMRHFFVTQRNWKNLSGIPDIFITNDLKNLSRLSLYGPPGIEHFVSLLTSTFKAKIYKKPSYIDENLEITSIPVNSSYMNPLQSMTKNSGEDVVYNYVVKIPKKPGEFNAEKCVNLGVPLGPHLLQLKQGEDVVLPNGRMIHSADVLDSVQPRTVLLMVDCPSFEFLDSFVSEKEFAEYQLPAEHASDVAIVFHYSPPEILKTSAYQEWIQKFHPNTEHYILHLSNCSSSSDAACQSQSVFHILHPEIFKLWPREEESHCLSHLSSKIINPTPMLQLHLRPQKKVSRCSVAQYNIEEFTHMLKSLPDFSHQLGKLESLISSVSKEQKYPEVLFLGTSSATSTAFRNVSGILVNVSPNKSVLLDCGEGTCLQLGRYFGATVNEVLTKISCVFISHMHSDHYLGLFTFIKAREEAFIKSGMKYEKPIVILPVPIKTIFSRFCDIFENLRPKVRIISCKSLTCESSKFERLSDILQEVQIETVPVKHCVEAYGIVLKDSTWKLVFSGDSAPCQTLIDAGENCDLLIHEASIEDGLINEATMKRHSTPSQVVDIAERMNAKYTILTHFSKRYLSIPLLPGNTSRPIGCAFDFMKVRLHELQFLHHFLPILKNLFQEDLNTFRENSSSMVNFENVFVKTYQEFRSKYGAQAKSS